MDAPSCVTKSSIIHLVVRPNVEKDVTGVCLDVDDAYIGGDGEGSLTSFGAFEGVIVEWSVADAHEEEGYSLFVLRFHCGALANAFTIAAHE